MRRAAAAVLLATIGGSAGPLSIPARARPQASPTDAGASVRGRVVSLSTGEPIRGALVSLMPRGRIRSGSIDPVVTDDRGRFEFTSIQPGTFVLSTVKAGYVRKAGLDVDAGRAAVLNLPPIGLV